MFSLTMGEPSILSRASSLERIEGANKRRRVDSPPLEEGKGDFECMKMTRTEIDESFEIIMQDLREKKKISVAAHLALRGIKERYGELINSLAKLVESNIHEEEVLSDQVVEMEVDKSEKKSEKSRKRKGKKAAERKAGTEGKSSVDVKEGEKGSTKGGHPQQKDGFTKVESKKSRAKNSMDKKLDMVKNRKPENVFILTTDKEGEGDSRKRLWSDLLKRDCTPRMRSYMTPKGELILRPADEGTLSALRSIGEERGLQLREGKTMWPKVMVYDVDRDLAPNDLPGLVADQNPDLGLDRNSMVEGLKPEFRKGPKEGKTTWWVCSARPDVYRALLKARRIFIGLMSCKVKEFVDLTKCFKCQRYGHTAATCRNEKEVCTRCSGVGHNWVGCKEKVKCANCGLGHMAGSIVCAARRKALFSTARRTDYGGK